MKDLAQESVEIKNDYNLYPFSLKCDDIVGVIKLHKNTTKEVRKITRRDVPITSSERWGFYNDRSGWDGKCSYLTREDCYIDYNKWKNFMYDRYSNLKKTNKVSENKRIPLC